MVFQYAFPPGHLLFQPEYFLLQQFFLPAHKLPAGEISGSSPLPEAVTRSEGISSFFTPGLCTRKVSILSFTILQVIRIGWSFIASTGTCSIIINSRRTAPEIFIIGKFLTYLIYTPQLCHLQLLFHLFLCQEPLVQLPRITKV